MTKEEMMDLVDRSLFATIGYTDEQGRQNVRRVFCVWHRGLGGHLISTNTGSSHVQSLLKNDAVCLYGRAAVHLEREYKELLWNDGDEKYYPKGVEDEDYCVLEIRVESGRFYRYDGKGDLTGSEIEAFDTGKEYENGYAKTSRRKNGS